MLRSTMCLKKCFIHLFVLYKMFIGTSSEIIKDSEYVAIPPLFHFDDYDRCMLYGKNALYCSLTIKLYPEKSNNTSNIWKIIEKISSKPSNYRHDLLRHGVCIPETCRNILNISNFSEDKLKIIEGLEQCYNHKYKYAGLKGDVVKIHCESQKSSYLIDAYDISFAVFVISYIIFVIFASLYEGIARYKTKEEYDKITETPVGKFLSAFSVPKNFYRLKTVNRDVKSLGCIQGIRFYNMICVILAHTLMMEFGAPVSNPMYTETMNSQFLNAFVTNGGYVVQTFFLISGWLLTYNIFSRFDNRKRLEIRHLFIIFVRRYVRLTPTVALVIALHSTWLVHISKGPFWDQILGIEYRNCRENWWTNLLYVNNYVHKENMCLQQTWYLATDTQLFLISLIVIYVMKQFKRHVKFIITTMMIIGIAIPAVLSYINNYDILVRQFPEPLYNFLLFVPQWHVMYSASYSNIGGYAIGIMFGYIFYKAKTKPIVISRVHVIWWWILSFGLPISVILAAGKMYQDDYTFTNLGSALYWGFGKNIFALGLGIAIFGMTQNIGWFVLWFCRWPPAQILGRLTFSAYLIHTGLIKLRIGFNRHPLYITNYLLLHACLGDVVLAYLIATLITILIEMPLSALQKLLFNRENY